MLSEKFKKIFEVCLMAQDMVHLGGCSWTLEKNVCNYTPSWYWKAWFVLSLVCFLILSNRSVCNSPSLHCSLCYTEAASSCRNLDSVSVHQFPSCGHPFSLLVFQHTSPSRTPPGVEFFFTPLHVLFTPLWFWLSSLGRRHSLDVCSSFLWWGFDTPHQATPLQFHPPYLSLALTSTCWSSPLCEGPLPHLRLLHFTSLCLLEDDPSHSAWAWVLPSGLLSDCASFSFSLGCDDLLEVKPLCGCSLHPVSSTAAPVPGIDHSSPYWDSESWCWITSTPLEGYPPQTLRLWYTCWATPPRGCSSHLIEAVLTLPCWCPSQLAWPLITRWAVLLCTS